MQPTPYHAPPRVLTADCVVAEPPSEDALWEALRVYPGVTNAWEARTLLLAEYTATVLRDVGTCNLRQHHLREWIEKQKTYTPQSSPP